MSSHGIPAGTYNAKCTGDADAQFGYSEKGSEQISLVLELLNEGYEGRRVTWFGSFASEESTKITMRTLRDLGWETDEITDLRGVDKNEVEVVIAYETYAGKERMKIKWIGPVGGARVEMKKPMDDAQRRAFGAKLKGAAMQSRKPAAGATNGAARPAPVFGGGATTRAPAPTGEWDGTGPEPRAGVDDIPFATSQPNARGL